jgi:DNA replication protein DnaC
MHTLLEPAPQPRDREEPIRIGDIAGALTRDEYIATAERAAHQSPDSFFPLGVCRHCNEPLGSTDDDKVIPFGAFGFLPNVCCHACAEKGKARYEQEKLDARNAAFRGIIPPIFLEWDDALGNTYARSRAFSRFQLYGGKGLVLHGRSGTGKTFICWQLIRLILEENERNAEERQSTWMFLDSFEASTKGIPAGAERVDFLFIDDLGNEPTSSKYETALLHLIRKRCEWKRALIITTQLTGAQVKARFFNGASAAAIIRRFRDCTESIEMERISTEGLG